MHKILLLLAVFLMTSCSSDESDCCINIDTAVSIKYVSEEGEKLFGRDSRLTEADITIYHKKNDKWVEYYKGNLDSPKGIRIDEREGEIYLTIFPSTNIVEERYSETKIEFFKSDSDILRTEIDKSNTSEIVTKVWCNGELKWARGETERMFTIKK